MKNSIPCLILSLFIIGCAQIEPENLSGSGQVRFKSVLLNSFAGNMPDGRIEAASSWTHIFKDRAVLEVVNKNTAQNYLVDYNPNEFGEGFSLTLPYGSYTYFSEVEGGNYSKYLPYRIEGEFVLNAASLDISMIATTDYGLITVKNEYVGSLGIRHKPDESYEMGLLEDGGHYFIYTRKGLNPTLEINGIFGDQLITRQIAVESYNHYHFFLRLAQKSGKVNFIELALGAFEYTEEGIELGEGETETFTDPRDGQVYRIVRIGEQTWMAENLNFNGYCYDNDDANCDIYGRLGFPICPEGWHIPSKEEWQVLLDNLGGAAVAGGKLKARVLWDEPNTGATNASGFSALPGGDGYREEDLANTLSFKGKGQYGVWRSSNRRVSGDDYFAWYFSLSNNSSEARLYEETIDGERQYLASCRCLKD